MTRVRPVAQSPGALGQSPLPRSPGRWWAWLLSLSLILGVGGLGAPPGALAKGTHRPVSAELSLELWPEHTAPPVTDILAWRRHLPTVPTAPFVLVFVYHQVGPTNWRLRGGPDYITPQRCAEDFAFFHRHHIDTLTAYQFLRYMEGKERVPFGSVYLTFDNGLEGVYRYAFPLAKKYHIHFTTFIIGDRTRERATPGDRFLTWPQLRTMLRSGWVDVQSESYDLHFRQPIGPHRYGPGLLRTWQGPARWEPLSGYVRRLRIGLGRQRQLLQRYLHETPYLLVWPFSTYNRLAVRVAREVGYRAAFVVGAGYAIPGAPMYTIPRNDATFMKADVPEEYATLVQEFSQILHGQGGIVRL